MTKTIPIREMSVDQPDELECAILKETYLPRVLPPTWRITAQGIDGTAYIGERPRLGVIVGFEKHQDGNLWQHLSVSREDRLPDWDDLVWTKEIFMGLETTALQVLAPRSQWVNIHKHCLHLWRCLTGNPTPDFTQGKGSL